MYDDYITMADKILNTDVYYLKDKVVNSKSEAVTIYDINVKEEWFQSHMRKINLWLSQLPIKGAQFTVHVL